MGRNSIQDIESVITEIEPYLTSQGFDRSNHLFHRCRREGEISTTIEGISLRFEYGFRKCWVSVTAKYPALVELLSEVRPFAYIKTMAWKVPDFASHVTAIVRLTGVSPSSSLIPYPGLRWSEDGTLRRARSVSGEHLGRVLFDTVKLSALPALEKRLSLGAVAAVANNPRYPKTGIAGAWPLAARIALGDIEGAAQAFFSHPYSLGADEVRFNNAKEWLLSKGVAVAGVNFSQTGADSSGSPYTTPWLNGQFI